jgi:hypothetical protein
METGTDHFFGGGGGTEITLPALGFTILAALLILVLPRKYAFVPLLVACAFIPIDDQFVIAGIHMTMSRILILIAWVRLAQHHFQNGLRPIFPCSPIDRVFLLYALSSFTMYIVLWGGETGAIINRAGFLFNACGTYYFMRYFLENVGDLELGVKTLIWTVAAVAIGMVLEQETGRNVFAMMGGVPSVSVLRDGGIRSQGTYVHPLTAGAVGAAIMPLALGLRWVTGKNTLTAVIGVLASLACGLSSRSSTAILVIAASVLGLFFWRLRDHLRPIRWGIVISLVALHLVMKAPVWALIARIDLTGSSSGYHRFVLVDQFIHRFSEWWLVGTRTTGDWGWDMWDTINCYVAAGTEGGLINFLLFVALFVVAFRQVGFAWRRTSDPRLQRMIWMFGTLLFAHSVAFFGIAYFDQSQFIWFSELAMIATSVALASSVLGTVETERVDDTVAYRPWDDVVTARWI